MTWRKELRKIRWQEGLRVQLPASSNRTAPMLICTKKGRVLGKFANGRFPFFMLVQLIHSDGAPILEGSIAVPVLPNGRVLMVLEERPAFSFNPSHPRIAAFGGHKIDIGPYGSLEFPGGAAERGEWYTRALLRELREETGIKDQAAKLYRCLRPVYPMSSEMTGWVYYSVIYLSRASFSDFVESDGGLRVFTLSVQEVEYNIRSGVIAGGHGALLGWNFFREIEAARNNRELLTMLENCGYIKVERVRKGSEDWDTSYLRIGRNKV